MIQVVTTIECKEGSPLAVGQPKNVLIISTRESELANSDNVDTYGSQRDNDRFIDVLVGQQPELASKKFILI